MVQSNHGRLTNIASAMMLIGALEGCMAPTPKPPVPVPPGARVPSIMGAIYLGEQQRVAKGGGVVTVDFGLIDARAAVPRLNNMPGRLTPVAWFSVRPSGGKREDLYDLKDADAAHYEVFLWPIRGGRTRWIMFEVDRKTQTPQQHQTGWLRECEAYHPPADRDVGFRDCNRTATPTARGAPSFLTGRSGPVFSASSFSGGETKLQSTTGKGWIACDYGCCSLSQQ